MSSRPTRRPADPAGRGEQQHADRHVQSRRPTISIALSPIERQQHQPSQRSRPQIDPSVFQPYTAPIARSPDPLASRVRVMSGSVIPAQKVAGSMMTRHSA